MNPGWKNRKTEYLIVFEKKNRVFDQIFTQSVFV
jgi:hypothetical protein